MTAIVMASIFLLAAPGFVHSTEPAVSPHGTVLTPVYVDLQSPINTVPNATGGLNFYRVLAVFFSVPTRTNATVFYTVGTFVPTSQCCPGAYLSLLSVDSGVPGAQIGCGADTSRFTNVLSTLSCFGRLSLGPGTHTITLIVANGGGSWTVQSGSTTSILVQFG
jgi:hypothetical protein